jgi:hypothetical protein
MFAGAWEDFIGGELRMRSLLRPLPESSRILRPVLSVIVYCDRGTLHVRYNGTHVASPAFDPIASWNALHLALGWCDHVSRKYSSARRPPSPAAEEEVEVEEEEIGWTREEEFEILLNFSFMPDSRMAYSLGDWDADIPWPNVAMRAALGEMRDALEMYYHALLSTTRDPTLSRTQKGYHASFLKIKYAGGDDGYSMESAEQRAAELIEGSAGWEALQLYGRKPGKEALLTVEDAKRRVESLLMVDRDAQSSSNSDFTHFPWSDTGENKVSSDPNIITALPPLSFVSLPLDILAEISGHIQSRDLYAPVDQSAKNTLGVLSLVCRRFQLVFQPLLFRDLVVRTHGAVVSYFRIPPCSPC